MQVAGQIYRYLDDVKVIKKRKPQKNMETNASANEGPISFFLTNIQRGGKADIISDFGTAIPFVTVHLYFVSSK